MILSAHQPCYLPWLGYFNKMHLADTFVILDDVQYEKNSYINRVQIKTPQGARWLTVPVKTKGHTGKTIREMETVPGNWNKHWKTIQQNYRKTEWFMKGVGNRYLWETSLSSAIIDFAIASMFLAGDLCLKVDNLHPQSTLGITGTKQDLIINLCKHFNADTFLFGAQGRGYVEVEKFRAEGITCLFQDFSSFEYKQMYGDFIPGLSVIDALFNVGPTKTKELICSGFSL